MSDFKIKTVNLIPTFQIISSRDALALFCFLAIVFLAFPLCAQVSESQLAGQEQAIKDQQTEGGFKGAVGIGVGYVPEFEGSDKYELKPLPILDLRYERFFLSTAQGLGYNLIQTSSWTLAAAVNYSFGRDESDSLLLRGLGDVSGGLTIGGLVSYHTGPVMVMMDLNAGVGSLDGSLIGLGGFYAFQPTPELSARLGLSTQYATAEYNRARFGINSIQAARSGYTLYDPGAGFKHVAFSGTLNYPLTDAINLGFFGEYRVLTGPAADSPLIKRGSDNQLRTGLTIGYQIR